MQTDRNLRKQHDLPKERTNRTALGAHPVAAKLLFSILGSGLLAVAGPVTLCTVEQTSLISVQILLELARLGLAAFQVFCA